MNLEIAKQQLANLDCDDIQAHLTDLALEEKGTIWRIINLESFEVKKILDTPYSVVSVALHVQNQTLFCSTKDGKVFKLDLESQVLSNLDINCSFVCVNQKFLTTAHFKEIKVWNPTTLEFIHSFKKHRDFVLGLCFRKGKNTLYSCGRDRVVNIYELDDMAFVDSLYGHQDFVCSLDACGVQGRFSTVGSRDRSLRVWKEEETKQHVYISRSKGSLECVAMISEYMYVTGDDQGTIELWSSRSRKPVFQVRKAHDGWITALESIKNADIFASGSWCGNLNIWKIQDFKFSLVLQVPVVGVINHICSYVSQDIILYIGTGIEHKNGRWFKVPCENGVFQVTLKI